MIARVAEVVSGIGPKIKSLRKQNGYSLQSLAERADVSAATIHKIEQSDMVPTITTLLKIAGAFELPVSYFVEDDDDHLPTVHTRAANRRPIYTSHAGLDLAGITGPYGDFLMAAAVATVLPGASSGSKPMGHPGEELLYVMSGKLAFTVADTAYMLGAGDSLHFRTQQPHSWRNPAEEDCVVLWMALRPQQ
ncbi:MULTISPECIES: helix-turn-helix domain-containing protein [Nonomuraea]|uniref:Helix-turn-helix domain-containing protein n=2 Tax=Nonomuraea TaxID=83681 RepID=A0ABW1C693_9ACTN|nr:MULTISPECIES: cupin domain-containing protein [Nonomuraea]MDA0647600.1 cupin domain-containing protein [Nonomuraea ferruginea]TXK35233.1 cupin domain-containing protein [Nonomuraea sp. C10]